jgi:hypothetical protein
MISELIATHKDALIQTADNHLQSIVTQLIKAESLDESWNGILLK